MDKTIIGQAIHRATGDCYSWWNDGIQTKSSSEYIYRQGRFIGIQQGLPIPVSPPILYDETVF